MKASSPEHQSLSVDRLHIIISVITLRVGALALFGRLFELNLPKSGLPRLTFMTTEPALAINTAIFRLWWHDLGRRQAHRH